MKRIKMNRRDFIKGSAFITSSAAGASLFVADNPELEAAPASAEAASATRTTALSQLSLLWRRLWHHHTSRKRQDCLHAPG